MVELCTVNLATPERLWSAEPYSAWDMAGVAREKRLPLISSI